jgi:hypothetical protein
VAEKEVDSSKRSRKRSMGQMMISPYKLQEAKKGRER